MLRNGCLADWMPQDDLRVGIAALATRGAAAGRFVCKYLLYIGLWSCLWRQKRSRTARLPPITQGQGGTRHDWKDHSDRCPARGRRRTVSYTHLTLPTSDLV